MTRAVQTALAGAGGVLQVVQANAPTSRVTTSSSTFIDTGLTATITPTSVNSKILVIFQQTGLARLSSNGYIGLILLRGSTQLIQIENQGAYNAGTTNENSIGGSGSSYLDSPATTSPVTYKTQFRATSALGTVFVEYQAGITLMEIAG